MTSHDSTTLFARLCFAVPALYAALLLLINPASMRQTMENFSCGLRNFELALRGMPGRESPRTLRLSSRDRGAWRFTGVVLAIWAVASVATFAR